VRSSKDLAKRLRFDRFPRPDRFHRSYAIVGVMAALAGLGAWLLLTRTMRDRQYLPGPVSQVHATFGDRCDRCHDQFHNVRNDTCLECHQQRVHSEFEERVPRCAECHIEHRDLHTMLAVSNASCIQCHRQLETKRSPPVIQAEIGTFSGHPTFSPLRKGITDQAAVRFNHHIHLTSDQIAKTDTLTCASCHQLGAAGSRMRPIRFQPHCKRCHKQEVPGPTGSIEALHTRPDLVRVDLAAQLSLVGIRDAEAIFAPPARPLPGVHTPPIDESRTLREYQERWLKKLEGILYEKPQEPAVDAPRQGLLELNKYCFLCHFEADAAADGQPVALKKTHIPKQWLQRAEFSHRKHELMGCKECHGPAQNSQLTTDVNLPNKDICTKCHVDAALQSAGTACTSCHLYHDTSKNAALRAGRQHTQTIDVFTGKTQPGRAND